MQRSPARCSRLSRMAEENDACSVAHGETSQAAPNAARRRPPAERARRGIRLARLRVPAPLRRRRGLPGPAGRARRRPRGRRADGRLRGGGCHAGQSRRRRRRGHRPPPRGARVPAARRPRRQGPLGRHHGQPAPRRPARRRARGRSGWPPATSPGCTARSASTSAPAPRPRSPSPRWRACWPTATPAPAASPSKTDKIRSFGTCAAYSGSARSARSPPDYDRAA